MRIITVDDLVDIYNKTKQRGIQFIVSKLNFSSIKRTKSAFDELNIQSANWWIIPKLHKRWNRLITDNETIEYKKFTVDNFLSNNKKLKMLSIGSGDCMQELEFASYENFEKILCIDITDKLLDNARKIAKTKELKNIIFKTQNIYDYEFFENEFDVVFFHASLHHFKNIEDFLSNKVKKTLKKNGTLIINEFVGANRLQFPKHQIKSINEALKLIPRKYRKRFKSNLYKDKVYGSGLIRMMLADPSECIESENILPTIHYYFKTIYEAPFGGNILMTTLKDISHHFIELDYEKEIILDKLFEFEDSYLKKHPSDFIFGVYENLKS